MSLDSQWDTQTAVFTKLAGHTPLTALAPVYDDVPDNAAFPYVTLGTLQAERLSTQTSDGLRLLLTIESFSRYRGFYELRRIMAEITAALDRAALTIPGQVAVSCRLLSAASLADSDGRTRRGTQQFEIITEPSF